MYVEGNYVFGVTKQEFPTDQRVVIGRTASPLDGRIGTILGKSFENTSDAYVVMLDNPIDSRKAIILTEVCLCPIGD